METSRKRNEAEGRGEFVPFIFVFLAVERFDDYSVKNIWTFISDFESSATRARGDH